MQLAGTEFDWLKVGGFLAISLRPTLRAAFLLERRYDGFNRLCDHVVDGSAFVIADLIATCAVEPITASAILNEIARPPLKANIDPLIEPLTDLVLALAGVDVEDTTSDKIAKNDSKPISWREYHTRLFSIGTGWLGWTPETTWNATPAEIIEGYKGRVEMLNAMAGSVPQDDTPPSNERDPDAAAKLKRLATVRAA